jgi:hypothetical protein
LGKVRDERWFGDVVVAVVVVEVFLVVNGVFLMSR